MPRCLLLPFVVAVILPGLASAADPARPRDLLPDQSTATIELRDLVQIAEHPLVRNVWSEWKQSIELQRRMEAPEFDRVRQIRKFIEKATGADWKTALAGLTGGGVAVSITGEPGTPAVVSAAVAASDEAMLRRVMSAAQETILSRIPEERRPAALPSELYREIDCVHFGDAFYAVSGKHLLLANRNDALHTMIDRLIGGAPAREITRQSAPLLRVQVDLLQLQKSPELSKPLTLPGNDVGLLFFFGGWVDVLSRASDATAEVFLEDQAIEARLSLAAGRKEVHPGLSGFFATEPGTAALPPLKIPGAIASMSWYRDYASLWSRRMEAITPEAKQRLEEGNDQLKRQLEVLGARFTPAELLSDLGTHFRLVVARQEQSDYKLDLPEKLPAAAFLVDMRNEGFREKLTPLLRFSGLIAAADDRRMVTVTETYKDSELTSLRFREDAGTVAAGSRIRYQFSPTYGFARNHIVLGSTTEIVRQVIDALAEEGSLAKRSGLPEFTTETTSIQPAAVAAAFEDFRSPLLNSMVLKSGISLNEAERELHVLAKALASLRGIESKMTFGEKAFELRIRVGE